MRDDDQLGQRNRQAVARIMARRRALGLLAGVSAIGLGDGAAAAPDPAPPGGRERPLAGAPVTPGPPAA